MLKDHMKVQQLNTSFSQLQSERSEFEPLWKESAKFLLPKRYYTLYTERREQGKHLNSSILDETGLLAARTCAAGLLSGMTSPARPWFSVTVPTRTSRDLSWDEKKWLSDVEELLQFTFSQSNYYLSKAVGFLDLVVFGTSAKIIYEDPDTVIRTSVIPCGEYFLNTNNKGEVDQLYREFQMPVRSIVQEFGINNVPYQIKDAYQDANHARMLNNYVVRHVMQPSNNPNMPWEECYWTTVDSETIMRHAVFHEKPFTATRWDVLNERESYGRSLGMDAIAAVKQVQHEAKVKAQGLDKQVKPPMLVDTMLKNSADNLAIPGSLTFVSGLSNVSGARSAYDVRFDLNALSADIEMVQKRIKEIFFVDLFLMISQLDTVRTATEIDARREEKLLQLGGVFDRMQREELQPDIERTYAILERRGLIPPPPDTLVDTPIQVKFVSVLSDAQQAVSTIAIERTLAMAGNMAAVWPSVVDTINEDEAISIYAERLRIPPEILNSAETIKQLRTQRAQQQQMAQGVEMAQGGAQAAKLLSETDVGGGKSAFQQMVSGI